GDQKSAKCTVRVRKYNRQTGIQQMQDIQCQILRDDRCLKRQKQRQNIQGKQHLLAGKFVLCKAVGSQDTNWYLDDKDRSGIDDTVPKPKIKLFLVQEYVLILEKRELPEQRHRITDQKS